MEIEKVPKDFAPVKRTIIRKFCSTRMSAYESNIVWTVIDKTFGWSKPDGSRKTEDYISLSQFEESTEITQNHISETLKGLIWRRILTKRGKFFGINKQVDEWRDFPKGGRSHSKKNIPKGGSELPERGKKNFPIGGDTTNNTETITTEIIYTPKEIAEKFFNAVINETDDYKSLAEGISNKNNIPLEAVKQELKKFTGYWTEKNKSGKKQLWEMKTTFEVNRRLANWFGNINKFSKKGGQHGYNLDSSS